MQREINQELASFGIMFINALPILPGFVKKWLIHHAIGLTPLQAHILVDRAFWFTRKAPKVSHFLLQ
jgi:formate hydrogenlyase subunit 3/multisubunit Na+/H+ antiporter MnhD subunit